MNKSLRKKNFYEILNVEKNCTINDIKNSFIRLSKEYHPDKNDDSKESHEKFVILNEAYMTLSNPSKRQKYDQFLSEKTLFDFNRKCKYEDSYYSRNEHKNNFGKGFHNVKAIFPKPFVFTAFVLFLFIGGGMQFYTIRYDLDYKRHILDNKSRVASLLLNLSRREARLRGNEEQIKRCSNRSLNKFTEQELVTEYKRGKTLKFKKSFEV